MKKGRTHIKLEEYRSIKALADAGVNISTASRAAGRSYNTVDRIYKSEDFGEYTRLTKAKNGKLLGEATPQVNQVPSIGSDSFNLARAASALERIADAWENSQKKRSIF